MSFQFPDSGVPAAIGYAQESGIPFELGIIRNHYVGRTFIEPEQRIRALGVRLKHSATRCEIEGKRVVMIDDSIVRGTTSVKLVRMMYEAGAKEVHMRIASPPITHPDFYGIDTPDQKKLLAATHDLTKHVRLYRRGFARLPVRRGYLQGHGLRKAKSRTCRNSPTIASLVTTQPGCVIAKVQTSSANFRFSLKLGSNALTCRRLLQRKRDIPCRKQRLKDRIALDHGCVTRDRTGSCHSSLSPARGRM